MGSMCDVMAAGTEGKEEWWPSGGNKLAYV